MPTDHYQDPEELFRSVPSREDLDPAAYLPLVEHLVRDVQGRLPQHVSRDELISAGNYALAAAARSYEPERGVPFNAYATTRIRGALLDELRGMDWASRGVRDRIRTVEDCKDSLTSRLGRVPAANEIAAELSVGVAEIHRAANDEHRSRVNSLEHLRETTAFDAASDGLSPEEETLHEEQVRYLYAAISLLPDRTRQIIETYFFDNKTFAEIGEEVGLHGSRIAQIVQDTLPRMREAITQVSDPHRTGVSARRRAEYAAEVHHLAASAPVVALVPRPQGAHHDFPAAITAL